MNDSGNENILRLENVVFEVENDSGIKKITDGVSFSVKQGSFVCITGPNGGGKSTIAKLIMGIEKPTSGKIYFDGEDITDQSISDRAKKGISFAMQQPVRFKGINVLDLMRLASGKTLTVSEACSFLSAVGLCAKDYVSREVNSSLSGGELKRIEIATVIARGTTLSLFDEPEAGIDLWSFQNLIDVFVNLRGNLKGTVIIISHQERILSIADEIIVVSDGKVSAQGKREDILPGLLEKSDRTLCSKFHKERI